MPRYSIGNPAPGHTATVGRTHTGRTWAGGRCYATTLRCSCGWAPGEVVFTRRLANGGIERRPRPDYKVSNDAPSAGGRTAAQERYRQHLIEEGLVHA